MTLNPDIPRTIKAASDLLNAYYSSNFFNTEEITDYSPPAGVMVGSKEHIIFITLTLSIENTGETPKLWNLSRKACENDRTRYLFCPESLCDYSIEEISRDLKNTGISSGKKKEVENWKNIGRSISRKWGGDPQNFIRCFQGNTTKILDHMKVDQYGERDEFPQIIGEKKGPLWIKILRDSADYELFCELDKIPIKVDLHIARATVALGLISGKYSGQFPVISHKICDLWMNALNESTCDEKIITSLDISGPLRLLSKIGCMKKDGKRNVCPKFQDCPLKNYCVKGLFSLDISNVIIDTVLEP
jgi:hypothetical protein